MIQVGEVLEPNHILVNKYSPVNQTEAMEGDAQHEFKSTKLTYKGSVQATVDKVLITSNENEHFIVKVSFFYCYTVIVSYITNE